MRFDLLRRQPQVCRAPRAAAGLALLAALLLCALLPAADDGPLPPTIPPTVPPTVPPAIPPVNPGPSTQPGGAAPTATPPTGPDVATAAIIGSADPSVVDPVTGSYLLRPGDLIKVYVQDMPDLTLDSRVSPSGQLYYPYVKRIQVGGKSVDEVGAMIEKGLIAQNIKDPEVAIIVEDYAKRYAYIYGEVKSPCSVEIPLDRPISLDQAVALAGGFTGSAAEHRIVVTHRGMDGKLTSQTVDLQKEDPSSAASMVMLSPNDTVYVPSLGGVFVLGKVNKPGYQGADVARNSAGNLVSAAQSIALAAGFAEDADPEHASVLRIDPATGKTIDLKINLADVIDNGALDEDIQLKSGDTVVIPPKAGIYVMGEVDKPGKYFAEPGDPLTVTRIIALAGGFKQYADAGRVKLYRTGKVPMTLDVNAILKNEQIERDVQLQPGDIVFVAQSGL
ncbi:MAG: polysaccharide biosynthesis/export family protein [Planctomycetota bacterium]